MASVTQVIVNWGKLLVGMVLMYEGLAFVVDELREEPAQPVVICARFNKSNTEFTPLPPIVKKEKTTIDLTDDNSNAD